VRECERKIWRGVVKKIKEKQSGEERGEKEERKRKSAEERYCRQAE
jgi:hypothetical protein